MIQIEKYFDNLFKNLPSHKSQNLLSKISVLDAGAGAGLTTKKINEYLKETFRDLNFTIYALDVDSEKVEMLENLKLENTKVVHGHLEIENGTRLSDKSIDYIVLENTLYLTKHKKAVYREMKRILRSGGNILVADWHTQMGESVFHKSLLINEEEMVQDFESIGFQVKKELRGTHHFVYIATKI